MTEPLSPDAIRAGIVGVLAPLQAQLAGLEDQIEAKEAELKGLRELRTDLRGIIGKIDPDVPMRGRNGGRAKAKAKTPTTPHHRVSEERIDTVRAWIRENSPSEAFYAQQIADDLGVHQSGIADALRAMANRGVIRLDSVGGIRGKTKFYKLTTLRDD